MAKLGCEEFLFFGFKGNFCGTWNWTFSMGEQGNKKENFESIAFHVIVCLIYHFSVVYLQSLFPMNINASAAVPDATIPTPSTVAAKTNSTSASPTSNKPEKTKKFNPWKELLDNTAESRQWLLGLKFYHNLALSLVSFWMFATLLYLIYQDGRLNSWHDAACRKTEMSGLYGIVNFVYLATKIWEWVDSYILIVDRKPIITLHWFHHMTTFTMAAVTHNFPVGGFALINCLVHTVMYAHYASPIAWSRIFITSSQLLQFVTVMSIHVYGFLNPDTCFDMKPVFWEWCFCQGVVFVYFIYFLKFFYDEYLAKKTKRE